MIALMTGQWICSIVAIIPVSNVLSVISRQPMQMRAGVMEKAGTFQDGAATLLSRWADPGCPEVC
jgi:tetrahydromethanopterin S-methyltransferase subunit C